MKSFERGTVVVLTHNRRARVLQTLRGLMRLPDGWPIIVVDNGSMDDTAAAVRDEFPSVLLIRSRRNIGAAARNIAVAYVHTPYVAFCDDDVNWQPGSLTRAADIMDENSGVGVVNGRLLEGEAGMIYPPCAEMAYSPLDRENLPGPQVLGLTASACVLRTRAFYEAGGFWPPLFINGEEVLLALDLADRGWRMVYMDDVVMRRPASLSRNARRKQRRALRNAIWVAWMRLPLRLAWRETLKHLRKAASHRQLRVVLMLTLAGLLRAFQRRHVVSPRVAAMWANLSVSRMKTEDGAAVRAQRRSVV